MRTKNLRVAIRGSGGWSRDMAFPFLLVVGDAVGVERLTCNVALGKSFASEQRFLYAANTQRESGTRTLWPGATPEATKGIWPAGGREKWGRARPQNGFCRVQFLGVGHRFVLDLGVFGPFLDRTGCRTGHRTVFGGFRAAFLAGFDPENVVVAGQKVGAKGPLGSLLLGT